MERRKITCKDCKRNYTCPDRSREYPCIGFVKKEKISAEEGKGKNTDEA